MYLLSPSSRLLTVLCPTHTVCKCVYRTYMHTYVHIVNLINVYLCRQDCGHMYRHIYTHIYVCYVHIWNTYRVCICVSMFSSRNDFCFLPPGDTGQCLGTFFGLPHRDRVLPPSYSPLDSRPPQEKTISAKMSTVDMLLFLLFSCKVVSDSLCPRGLQHTKLPCPSLTSRACSNSCLTSQ